MLSNREYLYVPFEEYRQLKTRGAHWDSKRKAWYLKPAQERAQFKRWLGEASATNSDKENSYAIESSTAQVLIAKTQCWKCAAEIPVICLQCRTGKIDGAAYKDFTVSNITSMNEVLQKQLHAWKNYRLSHSLEVGFETYLNHCPKCGQEQIDFLLHCEPAGPFFNTQDPANKITIRKLKGKVRINGEEGFEP